MDKLFKLVHGGVYALIAAIIGLSFILISVSQFPGFDMSQQYISVLGCGPGLSPLFFSLGLFISGILALPSFIYFGSILYQDHQNEELKKRLDILSIIVCFSLSLIGVFACGSPLILLFHIIFAFIFFLGAFVLSIVYIILIFKDTRISNICAYPGFFNALMLAIHVITRVAWAEWAVFFGLIFWIFEMGIFTLYKKL